MGLIRRALAKAFSFIPASAVQQLLSLGNFPHTGDYQKLIGDGGRSDIVMACVHWLMRTFPESPPYVERRTGEKKERLPDHKMLDLLENPNPYYSGIALWQGALLSYTINGNAYWLKIRNGIGRVMELWWVPHWMMDPQADAGSDQLITHYEYRPSGRTIRVDPEDVVHFRFGLDPGNPRKGLSQLAAVMRELYTDAEASVWTASLLRNGGAPGVVVSPKGERSVSPDARDEIQTLMDERFTGENRGRTLVFRRDTNVTQFGFNPQQMSLKDLTRIPEERVTAQLNIPAIVAGLGAGLDRSTFANMAEAREMAYESNIIPTQRSFAVTLKNSILSEFETDMSRYRIGFDLSQVRSASGG